VTVAGESVMFSGCQSVRPYVSS